MKESNEMKIGLALGGGAFRGLAHIGVLQVLDENKIPVHMVAGTSMGALVGSLYCSGADMKLIERYAYTLDERSLVDVVIPRQGIISGGRIEKLVQTLTGNKRFEQMKIPFAAVATDIERGERVVIEEGHVWEGVRASISIPGLFKPVRVGDRLLVDGALTSRVPTDVVRGMGADFVISVDVNYHGGKVDCGDIASIIMQAFAIMEWEIIKERVNTSDVNIMPNLLHINMASVAQAEETIEIGREETRKMMPRILEAIETRKQEFGGGLAAGYLE